MAGLLQWDDLNKYRNKGQATAATTPAANNAANPSPVQASSTSVPMFDSQGGYAGSIGGSSGSGSSSGQSGISPETLGTVANYGSMAGLVTGNRDLSMASGMLGTAAALGSAKSNEQALGVISAKAASMMGVPSPVIGAVAGYTQSGMPGAKAGAVTGFLAANPITALAMGVYGLVTGKSAFSAIKGAFTPVIDAKPLTNPYGVSQPSWASTPTGMISTAAETVENSGMGLTSGGQTVSNTGTTAVQDYANFGVVQDSSGGTLSDGAYGGTIADTGMGVNSAGQTVSNDGTIAVQDNANFGVVSTGDSSGGSMDTSGGPTDASSVDAVNGHDAQSDAASSGGGGGCVIATHAVASGAFTPSEKRVAVRWCVKNLHGTWWGEAIRRGYRFYGGRHIKAGTAQGRYQEFKDYVDFATGRRRTAKTAFTFSWRSVQFFFTGLFLKD